MPVKLFASASRKLPEGDGFEPRRRFGSVELYPLDSSLVASEELECVD